MILRHWIGVSLAWVVLFGTTAVARADFQVPSLTGPVVDNAGLLSASTADRLSKLLENVVRQGGSQIQVLTVPDLGGTTIEEASIKVVDQWKLGGAKTDNGVLLMISKDERKIRIEVGQGLEGQLPDAMASRIIREIMTPRLRQGSPDRAVVDAVFAILHYTDPELDVAPTRSNYKNRSSDGSMGIGDLGFFAFLILAFMLVSFLRIALFGFQGGRSRHFPGYWGGGGGFGGGGFGGGGGWSGGGGGFSGGGASGGW